MLLNYKEYGAGEPIIILHGLLGMLDNWHSFAKKLSEDYWVISVDQRNHGKSFHSEDFDYKLLSDDLATFLDQMHIPKCHILGHSMGGKTALQFVNDHPDTIDKAIIVDISPKTYAGGHELIFEALKSVNLETISSRKQVETLLSSRIENIGIVHFLMKNLNRTSDGKYEWKANILALDRHYNHIKGSVQLDDIIETPTLFVKGELSNYITTEDNNLLSKQFEDHTLITIKDAGHWVHADKPTELLNSVKEFLKA